MSNTSPVNILFRFYSDTLLEEVVETVPAAVVDLEKGYYKILSVPFYAPKIGLGDVVWADFNEKERAITYRKTIQASGNSTIHAVMMDNKYEIDDILPVFLEMGCTAEKLNDRYFALVIPAYLNYVHAKHELDELEKRKIIDYAASGLSEKHR